MPLELFNRKGHTCLMFSDLSREGGEAVQANQFLIVDEGTGALAWQITSPDTAGPGYWEGQVGVG